MEYLTSFAAFLEFSNARRLCRISETDTHPRNFIMGNLFSHILSRDEVRLAQELFEGNSPVRLHRFEENSLLILQSMGFGRFSALIRGVAEYSRVLPEIPSAQWELLLMGCQRT